MLARCTGIENRLLLLYLVTTTVAALTQHVLHVTFAFVTMCAVTSLPCHHHVSWALALYDSLGVTCHVHFPAILGLGF